MLHHSLIRRFTKKLNSKSHFLLCLNKNKFITFHLKVFFLLSHDSGSPNCEIAWFYDRSYYLEVIPRSSATFDGFGTNGRSNGVHTRRRTGNRKGRNSNTLWNLVCLYKLCMLELFPRHEHLSTLALSLLRSARSAGTTPKCNVCKNS